MIKEYHFGSITIDGKTYNHDVEVRWTGEVLPWWRKESHVIDLADVKRAIGQNPDTIIISTGESGLARVAEEAKKFILERGIKLIIDKTEEATRTFNIMVAEGLAFISRPRSAWTKEESESEDYNPPAASSHSLRERAPGKLNKVIGLFHLTC